ncbi:MAG TPA: lytic transglycosylase F [Allosphingosinicella sp.]|nr:lytic transglycosylase F [Allosphingosinicella sp.]
MTLAPRSALLASLLLLAAACSSKEGAERRSGKTGGDQVTPPTYEQALPEALRPLVGKPFKGDLEEMVKRRLIRIAVPYSRTQYFIDRGVQRGMSYDYGKLFEDELNKERNTGNLRINVVFVPLPRDVLLPALNEGRVDMVVAQLTVTPERRQEVDFTNPTRTGVNQIVVTGPGTPSLSSPEQLSGKHIFVRKTSSYFQSVRKLNERLVSMGRAPVIVDAAPESLEDDDLLEMVNAGLVPAIVVDDYLATFWKQVFPKLQINEGAVLRSNGQLAVAIRKNSPQLAAALNSFIARNGLESVMGRMLSKRYLQSTNYVTDAATDQERRKLLSLVDLFRKYGDEYRIDYLLMAAQGYQESRLDQNAHSQVGAIGVMQVMPATGAGLEVGDIRQVDPNIHAGVKYMRFMMDRYYKDDPMDRLNKGLFTFASYNAGAGRIARLRKDAAARGLNPNVWFGNVEQVASEEIGRETVTYVSNIYKYYIAYQLVMKQRQEKEAARAAIGSTRRRF